MTFATIAPPRQSPIVTAARKPLPLGAPNPLPGSTLPDDQPSIIAILIGM